MWEEEESLIPLIFSIPAVCAITDLYCIYEWMLHICSIRLSHHHMRVDAPSLCTSTETTCSLASVPGMSAVAASGGNCIKIGLPGKLILSIWKGLREVIFSYETRFSGKTYFYSNHPCRHFGQRLILLLERVVGRHLLAHLGGGAEFLALKHESRILRHSSNPV